MTDERRPELQVLSGVECYRLLAAQQVGRLGVDAGHYPVIFPVNYALDGEAILIRTEPGTKLPAADYANVTFEVDDIDRQTRSGWSVLVRGVAEEVTAARRGEPLVGTRGRHRIPGQRVNAGARYGSSRRGSVVGSCWASGPLRQPIRRDTRMDRQVPLATVHVRNDDMRAAHHVAGGGTYDLGDPGCQTGDGGVRDEYPR
jgi:uncharacterized protein